MSTQKTYLWPVYNLKVKQYEKLYCMPTVYTLNAETLVKKVGQLNEEELKKMRRNIALILGFII